MSTERLAKKYDNAAEGARKKGKVPGRSMAPGKKAPTTSEPEKPPEPPETKPQSQE